MGKYLLVNNKFLDKDLKKLSKIVDNPIVFESGVALFVIGFLAVIIGMTLVVLKLGLSWALDVDITWMQSFKLSLVLLFVNQLLSGKILNSKE